MPNPYEHMKIDLMIEAEKGILDERDDLIISIFSDGESDKEIEDEEDGVYV